MKDLQLKLAPFGVIAGTVRDADGETMSGAEITLFRQRYTDTGHRVMRGEAEANTDDQGQYRIADLEPGKYFIKASPRANEYGFWMPVDHSAKPADAPQALLPTVLPGPVEVTPGSRSLGTDITLLRSRVFRVTVQASVAPGMSVHDAWLYNAPRMEGFGLKFRTETRNRAGEFEFHGVPPGAYTLEVRTKDGSLARTPLVVGGDMEGVRIAVGLPGEVTGHITVEGGDKVDLEGARIIFEGSEDGADARIQEDGSFATQLYAGHYQVYFDARNLKLIVKSIRSEGVDVYRKGLIMSDSSKPARRGGAGGWTGGWRGAG